MNYRVALNIYSHSWLIETNAAIELLGYLEQFRAAQISWNGRSFSATADEKGKEDWSAGNSFQLNQQMYAKEGIVFAPDNEDDMRKSFKGFDGAKVAVIPFSGPMMKGDFCGSFGTASMLNMIMLARQTKSVETILTTWDTPGGMVAGTHPISEAIRTAPKNTVSLVQGSACSAGYWGYSSSRHAFISAPTDIVGSIGTMATWVDRSAAMKMRGESVRVIYATKSTDKNRAFAEVDKGNDKVLIEELLDPMNNAFMQAVQANREGKLDLKTFDVLTGKTYVGEKAIEAGLVDGMQSFDDTLKNAMTLAPHKQKTTYIMSGTKLPFQKTLTAAKAESFAVTDAGFVATEEQLNNLEAHLTTAEQNARTAQANLEAVQTQLTEAQGQTAAAATTIQTLQQENQTLKTQAESFKKAGASFFGANPKAGNDPAADDDTDAILAALPHNQKADRMLNP